MFDCRALVRRTNLQALALDANALVALGRTTRHTPLFSWLSAIRAHRRNRARSGLMPGTTKGRLEGGGAVELGRHWGGGEGSKVYIEEGAGGLDGGASRGGKGIKGCGGWEVRRDTGADLGGATRMRKVSEGSKGKEVGE